jgi:hypothetical protein
MPKACPPDLQIAVLEMPILEGPCSRHGFDVGPGYGIAEAFIQGGSKVTVNSGKEESVEAHRD